MKIKENHGATDSKAGGFLVCTSTFCEPSFYCHTKGEGPQALHWVSFYFLFFKFLATLYTFNFLICRIKIFIKTRPHVNSLLVKGMEKTLVGNPLK